MRKRQRYRIVFFAGFVITAPETCRIWRAVDVDRALELKVLFLETLLMQRCQKIGCRWRALPANGVSERGERRFQARCAPVSST
jgi:hypothetical protein